MTAPNMRRRRNNECRNVPTDRNACTIWTAGIDGGARLFCAIVCHPPFLSLFDRLADRHDD